MNENSILEIIISLFNCPTNKQKAVSLLNTMAPSTKELLAKSNQATEQILEQLSIDENWGTRGYVAQNPSTPATALEKLSTDKNFFVRRRLANNPSTPTAILKKLSTDEDYCVRVRAIDNLQKK